MADDEIRQELGIDATNTFSVLAQLDAAFTRFEKVLLTTADRLERLNQASDRVDTATRKLGSANREAAKIYEQTRTPQERYTAQLRKLDGLLQKGKISHETHSRATRQAAQAFEASNATAKKFLVTWETLARVIQTQLIVRVMSALRDGLHEAYESALEFSTQIGEIRAINPERTFSQIADDVRRMSDAFNQPLSAVAEAQYQVLSDQFVTAADRANILTAANKLAKSGADDLSASAQLLTGALNAYGESSDRATIRASQFFDSVNLGRFRMNELGTALGRVQGMAYEVGLTMEELQATLIAITIGGVKSTEAATQLRGVMTALLKPSQDLKKAYRALGVESGEAAIATWGFQGTLQQLWEYSDKSADRMANLFRRVRGLTGVLRIAGSGAEKYNEALEQLNNTQTSLNEKYEEFISTDAERLTREINKLKNFFTAEFGFEIVSAFAKLSGNTDQLIGMIRTLTSDLPALLVGLTSISAILLAAGNNAKYATLQLGTFRGALSSLALLQLGHILGNQIGELLSDYAAGTYEAEREVQQKLLDLRKEETTAAILQAEHRNRTLMQGLRQYLLDANKIYLQDMEHFQDALAIQEQVNKAAFGRIMQARQRMTQELFSISEAATQKATEDIPRAIEEIQQQISDRQWAEHIAGHNLTNRFYAISRRFNETLQQAVELQRIAATADQQRDATSAWNRADALRQQAEEIAKQTGNVNDLFAVKKMVEELDERRIDALEAQAELQKEIARQAEERARQAEQHNIELEMLRREIEAKLKVTTEGAEGVITFKGQEDLKRDLAEADELIRRFVAKTRAYGKADFGIFAEDARAFDELKRELERSLASANLRQIEVAPDVLDCLYAQIQDRAASLRLQAPVIAQIEEVTGMDIVRDGLNKVLDEYGKRLNEITARSITDPLLRLSLSEVVSNFDKTLQKAWNRLPATADLKGIDTLLMRMREIRQQTEITDEDLRALRREVQGIDFAAVVGKGMAGVEFGEQMTTLAQSLRQMADLHKQIRENRPVSAEQTEATRQIREQIELMKQQYNLQNDIIDGKKWDLETGTVITSSIDNQTSAVDRTAKAVDNLASRWSQVSIRVSEVATKIAGLSGGEVVAAAAGGKAWDYLAVGGRPRGTDVIPAFLSREERIINAEASRRWSSQLTAMNAGIRPVFHSEGGKVTNVGDINVTVSAGESSQQTARSIGRALRREIRRGTLTL